VPDASADGGRSLARRLYLLLAAVVVVMVGYGVTLTVLPFYVERLGDAVGLGRSAVIRHVTWLTATYPLAQLVCGPVWGYLSDRMGRRPPLLLGLGGFAIGQVAFGLADTLPALYGARLLGGVLSSAILPIAAAYVADVTTDRERARGMAWLGSATSAGVVAGPAVGGLLAQRGFHATVGGVPVAVDGFSLPFFIVAFLGVMTLGAARLWLPESRPASQAREGRTQTSRSSNGAWSLLPLLGLAVVAQSALAMFESTFALHGQGVLGWGPAEVGLVFVVCGVVMAVGQLAAGAALPGRIGGMRQIAAGLVCMGVSLGLMMRPERLPLVLSLVALFALGMVLVSPNLAAAISRRGGRRAAGAALGLQSAAINLGQTIGPLLGGAVFAREMGAAYGLGAVLLVGVAAALAWSGETIGEAPVDG